MDHTYQDPNNRRRDRGNCEIDQRHNFNLTAVGETPQFANRTLSLVGSGWRLSGIYRLIFIGDDRCHQSVERKPHCDTRLREWLQASATTSAAADRCLCDIAASARIRFYQTYISIRSGRPNTQWLNPAAFEPPALGTLGNLGRTTLRTAGGLAIRRSACSHVPRQGNEEFRVSS